MLESKYSFHGSSYFCTLTFDDLKIAHSPSLSSNLDKKVISDFVKRLRRRFEYHNLGSIKYFAVGEYGEKYERAHYHLLLFGLSMPSAPLKVVLEDVWSFGFVDVKPVSDARCMYAAKYTCKALFNDCPEGKEKPFAVMSKNLGMSFLSDEKSIRSLREQSQFFLRSANGSYFNLPRRFRNRIFTSEQIRLRNDMLQFSSLSFLDTMSGILNERLERKINEQTERNFYERLRKARNV